MGRDFKVDNQKLDYFENKLLVKLKRIEDLRLCCAQQVLWAIKNFYWQYLLEVLLLNEAKQQF